MILLRFRIYLCHHTNRVIILLSTFHSVRLVRYFPCFQKKIQLPSRLPPAHNSDQSSHFPCYLRYRFFWVSIISQCSSNRDGQPRTTMVWKRAATMGWPTITVNHFLRVDIAAIATTRVCVYRFSFRWIVVTVEETARSNAMTTAKSRRRQRQ